MELSKALGQISEIHGRIAENQTFRGYRSVTVAFSAGLAAIAALAQSQWIAEPIEQIDQFLALWISVAAVSVGVSGGEICWRMRKDDSRWYRQLAWSALSCLAPSILAGVVITIVIVSHARESAWLLPGLWGIVFSLGVFSSVRVLPRLTQVVGCYYFAAGTVCLFVFNGDLSLSPAAMLLTFGVGQALSAAVLYVSLERKHGQSS